MSLQAHIIPYYTVAVVFVRKYSGTELKLYIAPPQVFTAKVSTSTAITFIGRPGIACKERSINRNCELLCFC